MTTRIFSVDIATAARSEERDGAVTLKGTVFSAGVYDMPKRNVPEAALPPGFPRKDSYKVRRTKEVITDPATLASLESAPLMFEDHYEPTLANLARHQAGFPIGAPYENDAGDIEQRYKLTTERAINGYRSGQNAELSVGFFWIPKPAPAGESFDLDMSQIHVEHVAQVDRGLGGRSIRLHERDTSMTPEERAAMVADVTKAVVAALKAEEKDAPKVKDRRDLNVQLEEAKSFHRDRLMVEEILGRTDERAKELDAIQEQHGETEDGSRQMLGLSLSMSEDEIAGHQTPLLRGKAEERLKQVREKTDERAKLREEQRKAEERKLNPEKNDGSVRAHYLELTGKITEGAMKRAFGAAA